jgi:hypothetical protein
MRIPDTPPTAALIIQLAAASRSGAMPLTYAPFSFSAAARVRSPNPVNRNAAASAAARMTTVIANHTRSLDTRTSPIIQTVVGKMGFTVTGLIPRRCDMTPVSTIITPIDATARATAGAVRSGRNTSTYNTNPKTAEITVARSAAGQKPSESARRTVLGNPGTRTRS